MGQAARPAAQGQQAQRCPHRADLSSHTHLARAVAPPLLGRALRAVDRGVL